MWIIVLIGPMGSGKDTVAALIAKHYGTTVHSLGDLTRKQMGTYKHREDTWNYYLSKRKINHYYWIKKVLKKIDCKEPVAVISGIRMYDELEYLKKNHLVFTIAINANPDLRSSRMTRRRRKGDPTTVQEFIGQESRYNTLFNLEELMQRADVFIENESTSVHLQSNVKKALKYFELHKNTIQYSNTKFGQKTADSMTKGDDITRNISPSNPDAWLLSQNNAVDSNMPRITAAFKRNHVRNILDVGCGKGRYTLYFAEKNFEVYALDWSYVSLKEISLKLKNQKLHANLLAWDLRIVPMIYETGFFDAVLAINSIHHMLSKQITRVSYEIQRITKKGGFIYFEGPTNKKLHSFASRYRKSVRDVALQIEPNTWVPQLGPQKGIPHHIFSKMEIVKLFPGCKIQWSYIKKDKICALLKKQM